MTGRSVGAARAASTRRRACGDPSSRCAAATNCSATRLGAWARDRASMHSGAGVAAAVAREQLAARARPPRRCRVDLGLGLDHHAAQLVVAARRPRPAAWRAGRARGCGPSGTWRTSTPTPRRRGRRTRAASGAASRRGPLVAQMTMRCSSRNAASSSSLMRDLVAAAHGAPAQSATSALRRGDRLGRGADRLARVLGLEHDRVAGLLEHLAHEPVDAGEAELDDHRAVARARRRRCAPRAPSARARGRSRRARGARPGPRRSAASRRRRRPGRRRGAARSARR